MQVKPRRFDQLFFFGYFFKKFDRRVGELGLQPAMLELIKKTRAKFKVGFANVKTKRILEKKPVLLVVNHPFEVEVVALTAALPPRKNTFLIMTREFLSVGENFSQHIIPVYLKKKVYQETKKLLGRLLKVLKISYGFSDRVAHKKNIASIKLAAVKIKKGNLVVLFPEGLRGKKKVWYPGVGYLLNYLSKNSPAFYVKAYIQGSSPWCILRRVIKVGWLFPKIQVTFAKAVPIRKILAKKLDSKKLTAYLKKDYLQWQKTLTTI